MGDGVQARRTTLSSIGRPIQFISGQFAGQTVRAELSEIQKADLGRKYARVDRRPLDPPPAVLLRLFYVYNAGTDSESEKEVENYDEIQNLGLLCNVDLFPVPGPETNSKETPGGGRHAQSSSSSGQSSYSSSSSPYLQDGQQNFGLSTNSHSSRPYHGTMSMSRLPSVSGYLPPSDADSDIVAYLGSYPITEKSKCTGALVGSTFVQPASVDYRGKKAQIFVFADLAVKIEGTFMLRYRMFDIFSKAYGNQDLLVQGECYGGPFRVYSTKEFPGLHASTDLTKHLARWGVRLNIRETERKRRRKNEQSLTPPAKGKGKDKQTENSSYQERRGSDSN